VVLAFIQGSGKGFDMDILQKLKIFPEHGFGKEHGGVFGASGGVLELIFGKAFQDEVSTGFEPGNHFLVKVGSEIGWQVDENEAYGIEACFGKTDFPGIFEEVVQCHCIFLGELMGFPLPGATRIECGYGPSFCRGIHGVSTLTFGGHEECPGGE
jgi:hypothetical protein